MSNASEHIAIIGLSCRFPKAHNLETFWQLLHDGTEAVTFFSDEVLQAAGVAAEHLTHPDYVKASAILDGIELFDADFFNMPPREVEITDPQHRLFLECAVEALQMSGYNPDYYDGKIGVYAGCGMSSYLIHNLIANPEVCAATSHFQLLMGNNKDFMPTRASYKLNLKGPSLNISTACSTSLVAIHSACQSLLDYHCDMALAGGVSIQVPQQQGYFYEPAGISSPDGHCRAFDAKAQGTVSGNGGGLVVLKRLQDALDDGDTIHAVICGSAVNNDGSDKVGYTAPSVNGQTEVIAEAQAVAAINPETLGYIEAHGTGTALGDPIEIQALTQAFRMQTPKNGFCAIGSVKSNFGHLDEAAGIAGLIKTVLALKHRQIPPSLHFDQPNPEIDFHNSPFFVNSRLRDWHSASGEPLRAGVSSFGIGGTNAHVILEQAPNASSSGNSRATQLLTLSAKTAAALQDTTAHLLKHLNDHPDINLADVAYTLKVGRKSYPYKRFIVSRTVDEAIEQLQTALDTTENIIPSLSTPNCVFMFSGQGSQYPTMGSELYNNEAVFREHFDRCAELLLPTLQADLRSLCFAGNNAEQLAQTAIAQPLLFSFEYALAQLWMSFGIKPQALIGHSIGEYVAACLAGVFSLTDALRLVAVRGQLMQQLPAGAMLAVSLPATDIEALLNAELAIAASNEPQRTIVAGTFAAIDDLQQQLQQRQVPFQRLQTSHAFHSAMMEPVLDEFSAAVRNIPLHAPQVAYISNVTGDWITDQQATDPAYYAKHLRQTVRFSEGIKTLLQVPQTVFLEIGPGHSLSGCVARHPTQTVAHTAISCLRHVHDQQSDSDFLLKALGKLWQAGFELRDWADFYQNQQRRRLPLPTYPFQRQRYWIEPQAQTTPVNPSPTAAPEPIDITSWFYRPVWRQTEQPDNTLTDAANWLIMVDSEGLLEPLIQALQNKRQTVIKLTAADHFTAITPHSFSLNPNSAADYAALFDALIAQKTRPQHIVYGWNLSAAYTQTTIVPQLLHLIQTLDHRQLNNTVLTLIAGNSQAVSGVDLQHPEQAAALGAARVIALEYPRLDCRCIDLDLTSSAVSASDLLAELNSASTNRMVAYRQNRRFVQTFEPVTLNPEHSLLKQHGVYLITGGFGSMGLAFAEHLARQVNARLALIGRHIPTDDSTLKAIEAAGGEVLPLCADVADPIQMQNVIAQTLARFGRIDGVIHTAGVLGQGLIRNKSRDAIERTFVPKIAGSRCLADLIKPLQPDFLLLCSSMASVAPIIGQFDYCAANAFLDAFSTYNTQQTGIRTIAIDWGVWQALGMIEQAQLPAAAKQAISDEIQAKGWHQVGTAILDRILSSPDCPAQIIVSPEDLRPTESIPTPQHPLFARINRDSATQVSYIGYYHEHDYWLFDEHRLENKAVLPGTGYLELARAAFAHCEAATANTALELRDVYFLTPLMLEANERREVRTVLQQRAEGAYDFVVVSKLGTDNWLQHARGSIGLAPVSATPEHDLAALAALCVQETIVTRYRDPTAQALTEFEERIKTYGPRWINLVRAHFGETQALAYLELPPAYVRDTDSYRLHPALLDIATGFLYSKQESGCLPFHYRRVLLRGALPSKIYSHVIAKSDNDMPIYDVIITDENGNERVNISHYALKPVAVDSHTYQQLQHTEPDNFYLEIGTPGVLDSLVFRPALRQAPAADDVEIEIAYVGLNFIEVLTALGLLEKREEIDFQQFGLECSGTIARVGANVTAFKPGDEIIAFCHAALSRYRTTPAFTVAPKPEPLTLEQAATLPVAYATAYYALVTKGRLRAGERVLIHAASGGVGMAAIHIAHYIGAEIYATAGTPEKRSYLKNLGVQHVMDSRSLAFADEVMAVTQGQGVNMVLNSLGGDFIPKSLSILARYGRFLELGKRDFMQNSALGLEPFSKSLSFFALDVGTDLPDFSELWHALNAHFQHADFPPLPSRSFTVADIAPAFEYMAQAKHIGKVLIKLQDLPQLPQTSGHDTTGLPLAAILGEPETNDTAAPRATRDVLGTLTGIWQELLGIDHIAPDADFFALNGDSLLAAQVLSRVHKRFRIALPMSAVFDTPTLQGLSLHIEQLLNIDTDAEDEEEGEI